MMDESDGEFGMYFVFCFSLFSSDKEASEVDKGGTRTSSKFPVNIKQKYSCLKAFKYLGKFTGKHVRHSLFLMKLHVASQQFHEKVIHAEVFSS